MRPKDFNEISKVLLFVVIDGRLPVVSGQFPVVRVANRTLNVLNSTLLTPNC